MNKKSKTKLSKKDQRDWDAYISTTYEAEDNLRFEDVIDQLDFTQSKNTENHPITKENRKLKKDLLKALRKKQSQLKTLDLHGSTLQNAHSKFNKFLESCFMRGERNLLIITGKGKNSPDRVGKIKEEFKIWVQKYTKKDGIVVDYKPASQKNGGDGAFYVTLKKKNDTDH